MCPTAALRPLSAASGTPRRKPAARALGPVLVVSCLLAACTRTDRPAPPAADSTAVAIALPRPSFTLTTTDGRPFEFRKETAGMLTFLMFGYKSVQKALSDGRWKLIRYPHIGRTQLFDLQSDPFETKDLSGDPAQAERIARIVAPR